MNRCFPFRYELKEHSVLFEDIKQRDANSKFILSVFLYYNEHEAIRLCAWCGSLHFSMKKEWKIKSKR